MLDISSSVRKSGKSESFCSSISFFLWSSSVSVSVCLTKKRSHDFFYVSLWNMISVLMLDRFIDFDIVRLVLVFGSCSLVFRLELNCPKFLSVSFLILLFQSVSVIFSFWFLVKYLWCIFFLCFAWTSLTTVVSLDFFPSNLFSLSYSLFLLSSFKF